MHIVELRMLNWCRFRGEHKLVLEPTIYGVTARKHNNPLASNWSGKTGLLEAIRFVLFGARPHAATTEDDWITNGEKEGGVGVLLSDGTVIERRRGRTATSTDWWCETNTTGKDIATRLVVRIAGGTYAFDAAAQAHIDALVGLDKDDFEATCWVEQKEADRFVRAKPAERMVIIGGWLKLDPLKRAEAATAKRINSLFNDETKTIEQSNAAVERVVRVLSDYFEDVTGTEPLEEVAPELAEIERLCEIHEATATAVSKEYRDRVRSDLDGQVRLQEKWDAADAQAKRAAEVNADLAALVSVNTADLEAAVDKARADAAVKGETASMLGASLKESHKLSCGKFDGKCPLDGHACPDTASMNESRKTNAVRATNALKAYDDAEQVRVLAWREYDARLGALAKAREQNQRREHLTGELRRLASSIEYIGSHKTRPVVSAAPNDQAGALEAAVADAHSKLERVRAHIKEATEAMTVRDTAAVALGRVRKLVRIQQAVLLIVGKQGAQRRVAEGAIDTITELANSALVEAGVGLTVAVRWSRETKDLADACSKCGAQFPRSKRAKVCDRCGAARGPKLSEKLECILSDTSGAAEDIAGVALQLAAATWLRSVRDSGWSTVVLDEPLSSSDPHNRRAMAQHFVALLRGSYGFEQAMITAHTTDAVDTMPGRIEVVAHESGSTVQVLK